MATKIKLKTGASANLPNLADGEPALATDTKSLYIGDSDTNVLVNPVSTTVANTINTEIQNINNNMSFDNSALKLYIYDTNTDGTPYQYAAGSLIKFKYSLASNSINDYIKVSNSTTLVATKACKVMAYFKYKINQTSSSSYFRVQASINGSLATDNWMNFFYPANTTTPIVADGVISIVLAEGDTVSFFTRYGDAISKSFAKIEDSLFNNNDIFTSSYILIAPAL